MLWFWYVSMAAMSGVSLGLAASLAESGKPLVGINVGIGVFCFTIALVAGIKHAIASDRDANR